MMGTGSCTITCTFITSSCRVLYAQGQRRMEVAFSASGTGFNAEERGRA